MKLASVPRTAAISQKKMLPEPGRCSTGSNRMQQQPQPKFYYSM